MASLSDQPRSDLRLLVGRVVVDYEVHIKICGHRTVDVIQKGDEFLMPMTRALFRNDFARRGIERRNRSGSWSPNPFRVQRDNHRLPEGRALVAVRLSVRERRLSIAYV